VDFAAADRHRVGGVVLPARPAVTDVDPFAVPGVTRPVRFTVLNSNAIRLSAEARDRHVYIAPTGRLLARQVFVEQGTLKNRGTTARCSTTVFDSGRNSSRPSGYDIEVALATGYNSVDHFIRLFKRFYGTTPKQYQQKQSRKPAG